MRLHLEFLDRAGHLADFVAAIEARQLDVEIADREFAHRLRHRHHRAGNIRGRSGTKPRCRRTPRTSSTAISVSCCCSSLHPGAGDLAILAVAAARDQIVGQFLDIGEIPLRALDEQQRRSGIAVGHLDGVLGLLEIARDGGFQFFQAIRFGAALSAFDRLQGVRDLRGGGWRLPWRSLNLLCRRFRWPRWPPAGTAWHAPSTPRC